VQVREAAKRALTGAPSAAIEAVEATMNDLFRKVAHSTSQAVGSSWAFVVAATIVVVWAVSGPVYHFSDTWQLVINTGTTIVTFLMVFLIQNTQNRDAQALHLKLDELIRAVQGARQEMFIDLEEKSDDELRRVKQEIESEFEDRHAPEEHIRRVRGT
jgi:low affinity Fe/Cu permease